MLATLRRFYALLCDLIDAHGRVGWSDALKPAKDRAKLEVRNNEHAPRLMQIARANGLRWDPRATLAVTQWAYASAG